MKLAAMVRRQYLISHFQVMLVILLVLFFSRLISQFHYVGAGDYTILSSLSYVLHVIPAEMEPFWGIVFMLGAGLFVMRFYTSSAYQACLSLGYSMWSVWRQVAVLMMALMIAVYASDLFFFGRMFQDAKVYRDQLMSGEHFQIMWERIDNGFAKLHYNPLQEEIQVSGEMLLLPHGPKWHTLNAQASWQSGGWSWRGLEHIQLSSPAYLRAQIFSQNYLTLPQLIVLQTSEDGLISEEVQNSIISRLVSPIWALIKCLVGVWFLLATTRFCSVRSRVMHGPAIVALAYLCEWLLNTKTFAGSVWMGLIPIMVMLGAYSIQRRKYG